MDENTTLINITIDEDLRTLTIPTNGTVFGVVGDISVNRVMFVLPRYFRGFDLTECTARVNYCNPSGDANYYEADDLSSEAGNKTTFTWLMGPDVTSYIGDVKFSIQLYKKNESGEIVKNFNTKYTTGKVLEGYNAEQSVTPEQQETLVEKISKEVKESISESLKTETSEAISVDVEKKKNDALTEIDTRKNSSLTAIENEKNTAVKEINSEQVIKDVSQLKEDLIDTKKITGEIVTPIITKNVSLKSGENAKLIDGVVGKTYLVLMDVDYVYGTAMLREYQYQWTGGLAYNQNDYFLITLKIGNIYIMPTGTNTLNANVAVFDVTDNEKLKEYIVATGYEGIGTIFGGAIPEIDNTLSKEGQAADAKAVGDKCEKIAKKSNTFQYFRQSNPIKSTDSTYIDISTAIKNTANYTLRTYEVTPRTEVKIQGACLANSNTMLRYMFSSNIDGTEDITKGSATTGWTDSYEEKVTVPDSANYLLVNNQNSSVPYVYVNTNIDVLDLLYGGWRNKKLVTYGDSITEGNTWQPYLMRRFGFDSIINKGIGGTTVAGSGSNAFCSESRVQTVPSDADLVLIMGGTNDYSSIPIGALESESDIQNTTFKGALALTIKRMQEQCPNAVIMVCSPLSGRGAAGENETWPEYNSAGKTTYDYAVAVKEVAEFLSIPYIPVFERCGINQWNRTKYMGDSVHPRDSGGLKVAMAISEVLCTYQPF